VEIARNGGIDRDERPRSRRVWKMQSSPVWPTVHSTLEISVKSEPFASRLNIFTFPKILYQAFGLFTRNLSLRIVSEIDDVVGLCVVVDNAPKPITESVL
jgi:hypothetical protein